MTEKKGILYRNAKIFETGQRIFDMILLFWAGKLSFLLIEGRWEIPLLYWEMLSVGIILLSIIFPLYSLYQSWRGASLWDEIRSVTLGCMSVFSILTVIIFLTKTGDHLSRAVCVIWMVSGWGFLIIFRVLLRAGLRWVRARGFNYRRVVVVGSEAKSRRIIRRLREEPGTGLKTMGFFDTESEPCHRTVEGLPVLGTLEDMDRFLEKTPVDQVWIVLPVNDRGKISTMIRSLHNTVEIFLVPDSFTLQILHCPEREIAGIPALVLNSSPRNGWNCLLKGVADYLLSFMILCLFSPLMLLISVCVKVTSEGPVIFRQKRHGLDGSVIEVWKFRTMYLYKEEPGKVTQATEDDPRVTPLGAFLRSTSLDEFPQFVNVLQGRMSVVGPRPHATEHNEYYKDLIRGYMFRHKIKPGITGWAQVNGFRGETKTLDKMKQRVVYDINYIEKWSLWLDMKIIFRTFLKFAEGFFHKKAY